MPVLGMGGYFFRARDPAALKAEDFWDFGPLNRALDKLGRI